MYYGNAHNLKITVANSASIGTNLDTIVKSEKLIKVIPTVDMYILLTAVKPTGSNPAADAQDFLMKANTEYEFGAGTGMDRITFFNNSGSSGFAHVMVMY